MNEHTHAVLYRAFLANLEASFRAHEGSTSDELTRAFEREGILTQAMALPEVRRALTIILLQAMVRDQDGALDLDLSEESLFTD